MWFFIGSHGLLKVLFFGEVEMGGDGNRSIQRSCHFLIFENYNIWKAGWARNQLWSGKRLR
jgi:hypothetical protein